MQDEEIEVVVAVIKVSDRLLDQDLIEGGWDIILEMALAVMAS